jgi:ligand-binding sensor domain-containing protein/serine phosphatase RsbU (regulator of sigma subunit)
MNSKTKQITILLLLVILILFPFSYIFSQLKVKNYYSFTGKKDVVANIVSQDHNGYLWIGTKEGLYKFDGKTSQLINFTNNDFKKNITALYFDKQNTLWLGTNEGIVYTLSKGLLDSISYNAKDENTDRITSFTEVNQSIFIGTYGNGLYKLNNNKITEHYNSEKGLSDNVIYNITSNGKDKIWLATDAGMTQIDVSNNSNPHFKIISSKDGLPDNIVRNIDFNNGKLIISMQDSGICYYNIKTEKIEKLEFFSNWTNGTVLKAKSYQPDQLTICTEKNGILSIQKSKLTVLNYTETINTNGINHTFFDNAGQIWISSRKGISQFYSQKFNFIQNLNDINDNKILALTVDKDNTIWYGTDQGICKVVADGLGQSHIIPVQKETKYTISCATTATDGSIWFGTYGNGLMVIDPMSFKMINFNTTNSSLTNDNISHIYFKENKLFISTLGGGLIEAELLVSNSGYQIKIIDNYKEETGLGSDYIYSTCIDNQSNLYVATDGKGLQMNKNGKFISLFNKFKLASNTAFSSVVDKNNAIWCVTNSNGIVKYNGKTIETFTQKNGLRDEQPQQLICYEDILYAFNSKGIDKININTNEISYYDVFDGDLEPNLNAIFLRDKKIFSGTNNGVLVYKCAGEFTDTLKPTVFIKSFKVNYKEINCDSVHELNYNENNITIEFGGIWLKNPLKLTFRYKLDGFDTDWVYSNDGKVINYNNLSHGNYRFVIQSKNEEDVWSEELSYSFVILTPIWKRWWFWVITVSVIVFLIYSFTQYRLKSLQKENFLLEQKVAERTFEIEKQSQIIVQKNKDITDSIEYAQKIQHAILPLNSLIKNHIPHSFVFYKTKDIVSGDFYWFAHIKDFSIIAAVDCTGHGVPGAFMSLIGYNLLNKIVNENKIYTPGEILCELNKGVLETLYKNETESKDGMDAAICKINHSTKTIEYAGAMRPLWIVDNNELIEIKADKIPIGTKQMDRTEKIKFHTHEFNAGQNKSFYIFTDGYADQFGGPKEKKYSTGKFKDLLKHISKLPSETQGIKLKEEHLAWKANGEQVDDILVIGFTI